MKKISQAQFDTDVIEGAGIVIVDVYADWCQPCKMLAPTLEKIASKYDGQIDVVKIDGETESQVVTKYKVSALPTLLFFKAGKLEKTLIGLQNEKQISEVIDSLL